MPFSFEPCLPSLRANPLPLKSSSYRLPVNHFKLRSTDAAVTSGFGTAKKKRKRPLFLEKYGYFGERGPGPHSPAAFSRALRIGPLVSHELPPGLVGGRWYKRHLSYRVVIWPPCLPPRQVRLAVSAAFQLWSNVSSLVFWEARDGPADIRLTFFHGDHNDGLNNAFDGPGGALAHAFFPRRGEAHFDSAERWSLRSGKGRNLFVVVAHEVGHTLGLEHSPAKSALMSPYYKKLSKDFVLSWDDILAVQNLYGKPSKGSAIQLPGKVFTHFQDWSTDLYSEDQQQRSLSTYYCHSFFDAITADADHNLYIFKGGHYWQVLASGNASDPRPLQPRWPGLPAGIDACAWSQLSHKFYFFKGGRCWRYSGSTLDAGFPQKCSARGLPRHPDTALYFQQLRRLVLFGLPPGTAGALTHRDGFIYFFRDDQYWQFDRAKLQVVATGKWATQLPWMGCWDANGGQVTF
ncbi:PREDICTED: matrix metalloproteinase-28 [Chaetura pelagica]|uniref:matrix metalloproteinase-28 n=1 Tax=Chaetura pelagica TaxID=8897 RepID=UPI0005234899|nr:PREDICTED: matrix metalloproteinase-28 [Chaetura pelagica]